MRRDDDGWHVQVQHRAHEQLVDLRVQVVDSERHVWSLKPDGTLSRDSGVLARRSILLFQTGARSIELVRFALPSQPRFVELRACLRNPNSSGESAFSEASEEVSVGL
jgi:hypothetical protein